MKVDPFLRRDGVGVKEIWVFMVVLVEDDLRVNGVVNDSSQNGVNDNLRKRTSHSENTPHTQITLK